ncbi:hypothetical protein ACHQM5_001239 [Ranunculus cassubicifolius]
MNVLTKMMWGGTLKENEGTNLGGEFRQVVSEITDLLGKPNISDFYPSLERFDLQGIQKTIKVSSDQFDKIFDTIIEQRLKLKEGERKRSKDFLQLLLQLKEEEDAKMPFTMLHLKALLLVKIRSIYCSHSSTPFLTVFINVWAIHRGLTIWDNPSEFDPERFLAGKWDYSGSDFKYFPFGSGRRICAGIVMAERMFIYELATLLHSFDWSLKEGEVMDLKEKFGIVMQKATPLVAVPTPRLSDPSLYL